MCGIAGILTGPGARPPARAELERMIAALRHRGPDGHGIYRDERTGLAHARLSLLDLQGGAQPMANEDRTLWISGNGEIFGHAALRRDLEARGHRFRTRNDIETILHAFEEWGERAWPRLDGQFAFALWDARARRLWLCRDRLGILPLHYAEIPGTVVFASEAKALFAGGRLAVQFDAAALAAAFALWAVPGPDTVFRSVRTVPPGAAITFDAELRARHTTWWQPDLALVEPAPRSLDEAAEGLQARLDEAVRLRLVADVPVGAYLSGGLDSSVVVENALRQGARLQTFAVRFEDPAFDETAAQRRLAALLGTQHHEIECRAADIRAALPEVVWHCETPLLRTAPVPMFLLSGLVRQAGIKAVLTGEGADELLGGYDVFKEDRVRRFWARRPDSALRPALLAQVHAEVGTADQRSGAMWQAFYRRGLQDTADPLYSHALRFENSAWSLRLLAPDVRAACPRDELRTRVLASLPPGFAAWRPLARAQAIEIATFLTPYLLASQGDRVALGHGIEVRYPFLDPAVVAYCAGLPDRCKLRGLRDKLALRSLAARRLPEFVWRRRKQPYRAPTASALFAPGAADWVDEMLAPERLRATGLVDVAAATALVVKARSSDGRRTSEREGMALTGLLSLQLLADHFTARLPARIDASVQALAQRPPDVLVGAAPAPEPRPATAARP